MTSSQNCRKKSTSYCWCRVSSQSCSLSCGEALDDGLTESFVLRSSFVILSALQRHGGDELLHFVGQSLFLCRLVLFQCNSDLPKEQRKVLITLALRQMSCEQSELYIYIYDIFFFPPFFFFLNIQIIYIFLNIIYHIKNEYYLMTFIYF